MKKIILFLLSVTLLFLIFAAWDGSKAMVDPNRPPQSLSADRWSEIMEKAEHEVTKGIRFNFDGVPMPNP